MLYSQDRNGRTVSQNKKKKKDKLYRDIIIPKKKNNNRSPNKNIFLRHLIRLTFGAVRIPGPYKCVIRNWLQ